MKITVLFALLILTPLMISSVRAEGEWKMNMVSDGSIQPNEKVDIWVQGPENAEAYIVFYSNYNVSDSFDQQKNLSVIDRYPQNGNFVIPRTGIVYANYTFADLGSYAVVLRENESVILAVNFVRVVPDPYSELLTYLDRQIADLKYSLAVAQQDQTMWRNVLLLAALGITMLAITKKLPLIKEITQSKEKELEKAIVDWIRVHVSSKETDDLETKKPGGNAE